MTESKTLLEQPSITPRVKHGFRHLPLGLPENDWPETEQQTESRRQVPATTSPSRKVEGRRQPKRQPHHTGAGTKQKRRRK